MSAERREQDLLAELARLNIQIAEENQRHAAAIAPEEAARTATLKELAEIYHGVKIGSIVKLKSGRRYRVNGVDVNFCWGDSGASYMARHKPWVHGNLIRKDGTDSNQEAHCYSDWELE